MYTQRTFRQKNEQGDQQWHLVDASGKTLGRLATEIANVLRGKNKPIFTPNVDCGDFVVVVNAEKVHLTGNKWADKKYYRHSGFVGGIKERTAGEQRKRDASVIVTKAVKGMLPKNYLAKKQLTKLKVFVGPEHTHDAQKPQTLDI